MVSNVLFIAGICYNAEIGDGKGKMLKEALVPRVARGIRGRGIGTCSELSREGTVGGENQLLRISFVTDFEYLK